MYNNLINSLKKILDDKGTQAEKLLKIQTLVDFAEGWAQPQQYQPQIPQIKPEQKPNTNSPKPGGPGAIVGVEDIK